MVGTILGVSAAFAAGFGVRMYVESWRQRKEKPIREALKKANETVFGYQMDEAYRAGQRSPESVLFDAPLPSLCEIDPVVGVDFTPFPNLDEAKESLNRNRRVGAKRVSGIWTR